jgi:hypothetical protein
MATSNRMHARTSSARNNLYNFSISFSFFSRPLLSRSCSRYILVSPRTLPFFFTPERCPFDLLQAARPLDVDASPLYQPVQLRTGQPTSPAQATSSYPCGEKINLPPWTVVICQFFWLNFFSLIPQLWKSVFFIKTVFPPWLVLTVVFTDVHHVREE